MTHSTKSITDTPDINMKQLKSIQKEWRVKLSMSLVSMLIVACLGVDYSFAAMTGHVSLSVQLLNGLLEIAIGGLGN